MKQLHDGARRLSSATAAGTVTTQPSHRLHFASRSDPARALSFPCDCRGEVQLDALSERARNDYFFARATMGCAYSRPTVVALESGATH